MHCASERPVRKKPRRRLWHVSPDGFRELRRSLFLSQQAVADALGVCLRTVRYWDTGRNRVPWSAVRLLRLLRGGDLGELSPVWTGWRIVGDALVTPAGVPFQASQFTWWALTCLRARSWQRQFREAAPRLSAGDDRHAVYPVVDGGAFAVALDPAEPKPFQVGAGARSASAPPGLALLKNKSNACSLSGLAFQRVSETAPVASRPHSYALSWSIEGRSWEPLQGLESA